MALPTGYFISNGKYWKIDGTGPYTFDGTSTMTLIGGDVTQPTPANLTQSDANYFAKSGAGPVSVGV